MALLKVKTESGVVEGLPGNNQIVSVFKGIPFAKPPVGKLRWKAPESIEPWTGEYQAYKYNNIAMQPRFSSEGGNTLASKEFYVVEYPISEDCLYLNVWTPAKSVDEKLPVAIYIHGGGFETGFSYLNAYDGEGFAKRGVIIVTISYRLGVFGFLANKELINEDKNHSTGNYGTMDQIAAIEWVIRNISAFGGDPEQITLFGQSAGGFSVQNMCQTPLLKGKIKRAIMQSGGGLIRGGAMDLLKLEDALLIGEEYFKFIDVNNIEEARSKDSQYLIEKYQEFKQLKGNGIFFMPVEDGYILPQAAADYFMDGKHPDIEYLIGCTKDEMRNKNAKVPDYETIEKMATKRFGHYSQKYLETIKAQDKDYTKQFFEDPIGNDMRASNLAWLENQVLLNFKPTYAYYFTYVPPGAEDVGAHHSVEHHYVFQTLIRSFRPYTGFDYDLSLELAGFWTNFMKTGNPNGEDLPKWTPYTKESPMIYEIDKFRKMAEPYEDPNLIFLKDFSLKKL